MEEEIHDSTSTHTAKTGLSLYYTRNTVLGSFVNMFIANSFVYWLLYKQFM
jgi:hypothetical protein